MDGYSKTFLQLCFPLYVITIAIVVIVISHYSSWVLRWTYAKSFAILATLLLLSYPSVLRTSSIVLFFYSNVTQLPSGHQWLVWSVDASVQLFSLKFTILFLICLLILLALIALNILLLFAPRLYKINYLKPLLNPFQEPYKEKYYYWIGISLIFRDLFVAMQALQTRMRLIMSTILVITFSLLLGSIRPYKNKFVNIQELSLLLNLSIIYAVSYQDDGHLFCIISNVMISLALLQFCLIVLYHLLIHTCTFHCDITRIIQTIKHICNYKVYSER